MPNDDTNENPSLATERIRQPIASTAPNSIAVVLFFEEGAPMRKVWFYQLDPGRNLGKTNPLNDADLMDFIDRQRTFAALKKSLLHDAFRGAL